MSDALATTTALTTPSDNGQAQTASGEAQGESGGRPSENGQAAKEQENIRALQSRLDSQIGGLRREVQQRDQMVQQLTAQLRDMQKQSAPDDYTRLEMELNWERQEKAALQQRVQQAEQERQANREKQDALERIAKKYGVSARDLDSATGYEEAIDLAMELRDKQRNRQQEEQDDRRERNRPDLGGGKTSTAQTRLEQEYDEAMKRKDSAAIMRLNRELSRLARG